MSDIYLASLKRWISGNILPYNGYQCWSIRTKCNGNALPWRLVRSAMEMPHLKGSIKKGRECLHPFGCMNGHQCLIINKIHQCLYIFLYLDRKWILMGNSYFPAICCSIILFLDRIWVARMSFKDQAPPTSVTSQPYLAKQIFCVCIFHRIVAINSSPAI